MSRSDVKGKPPLQWAWQRSAGRIVGVIHSALSTFNEPHGYWKNKCVCMKCPTEKAPTPKFVSETYTKYLRPLITMVDPEFADRTVT
eukprot:gene11589-13690_t